MPQALTEESFLPSSLFTEVKGEANGKEEKKDVFILSHPDILDLMRYVWTGCYLPSEREEYISVMDIHKEGVSAVSDEIDLIVKAYADIKKDNTQFRDVTWKQLINLAGQVSNYAKKAGGSYNSSYYAGLIEAIADYNAESNKSAKDQVKTKLAEAKEAVLEFSKAMLTRVTQLLDDTEKCMNDLTTFKNLTKNHGVALKNTNDKVKGLLEGEDGEIKRLNTEITKLQKDLAAEQEEYHHDVVVAATTPTYAWCTIFGFIAAVTVASIYGKRATDMLNIIDETQKKIDNDKKKVEAAVIVTADCQRMTDGNDTVIDLIDKAIKTLGKMQAAWQLMKNDLTGIKDSASEDQGEIPGVAMEKRRLNGMIEQWNSLSTQVEYFEKVAYVSEPEYMTIKEFIKKIKGDGK